MSARVEVIRPGGQALADGVFMRTSRAWAIARADGSVEVGPMPVSRLRHVPVLRILASLGTGLKLGVVKGLMGRRGGSKGARRSQKVNRRFLVVLVTIEAAVAALTTAIGERTGPTAWAMTALPWLVTLVALRMAAPGALWRYHGAEHKAVTAFEQGVDLDDLPAVARVTRIHDRCGTNLVALMMLITIGLSGLPSAMQVPAFVLALAAAAELLGLAARWPRSLPSQALVVVGKALQRYVTTSEPAPDELAVGCRALQACLAEHHRMAASALAPAAAA